MKNSYTSQVIHNAKLCYNQNIVSWGSLKSFLCSLVDPVCIIGWRTKGALLFFKSALLFKCFKKKSALFFFEDVLPSFFLLKWCIRSFKLEGQNRPWIILFLHLPQRVLLPPTMPSYSSVLYFMPQRRSRVFDYIQSFYLAEVHLCPVNLDGQVFRVLVHS